MFTTLPITAQHTIERGVFDLQKVKFEYALGSNEYLKSLESF